MSQKQIEFELICSEEEAKEELLRAVKFAISCLNNKKDKQKVFLGLKDLVTESGELVDEEL